MNDMIDDNSLKKEISPLFIGGTGRSGTTILKKIFSNNNQILVCKDELRFIVDPYGILDLYNALTLRWDPYNADIYYKEFMKLIKSSFVANIYYKAIRRLLSNVRISPYKYHHIHISRKKYKKIKSIILKLEESLVSYKNHMIWFGSDDFKYNPSFYEINCYNKYSLSYVFQKFVSDIMTLLGAKDDKGSEYWVDDTPYSILHAQSLMNCFPRAKYIHIYRDPRDVVASYLEQYWGGDIKCVVNRLENIYSKVECMKKNVFNDENYLELSLESLINNTDNELLRISNFMFTDKQIQLGEIELMKKGIGKYKSRLNKDEIKYIQCAIGSYIERYSYEL